MAELMTTKELAEYLRIKERKIYELAGEGRIPCARVTGKLLFPRHLIDLWIAQATEGPVAAPRTPPPPVLAGSHDQLLEWALRESGCDLAMLTCGSMAGLERFAAGTALAAGLHVLDAASGEYNVPALRRALGTREAVLIEWGWRRQGLVTAPGNPLGLQTVADLARGGVRVALRQVGSGSQLLLAALLAGEGLEAAELTAPAAPCGSEIELGLAIIEGGADAGLAIEAVARQLKLHFIPLARERYDIVVSRVDYFDPPFQKLLAFAKGAAFTRRAAEAGGYDTAGLGRVVWNGD